jgi:hypothetical protein
VTIVNNQSDGGGGLGLTPEDTAVMLNTIIAQNRHLNGAPSDIAGAVSANESFNNLVQDQNTAGGLQNGINHNQVGIDPRIAPLSEYGSGIKTHALLIGSPAIDAGSNVFLESALGAALIADGDNDQIPVVDIGAVEMSKPVGIDVSLENSTLSILGTPADDSIALQMVNGKMQVRWGFVKLCERLNNCGLSSHPVVWEGEPSDVERIEVFGRSGNDILNGTASIVVPTLWYGGSGDDTISGNGGNDAIFGQRGFDELSGKTGGDLIVGGSQYDFVESDSNDIVRSLSSGSVHVNPDTSIVTQQDAYVANSAIAVAANVGVLANDRNLSGGPLQATIIEEPRGGILRLQSDGSFDYTPNAGFTGLDLFVYGVGAGNSQSQEIVTIYVGVLDALHADLATALFDARNGFLENETNAWNTWLAKTIADEKALLTQQLLNVVDARIKELADLVKEAFKSLAAEIEQEVARHRADRDGVIEAANAAIDRFDRALDDSEVRINEWKQEIEQLTADRDRWIQDRIDDLPWYLRSASRELLRISDDFDRMLADRIAERDQAVFELNNRAAAARASIEDERRVIQDAIIAFENAVVAENRRLLGLQASAQDYFDAVTEFHSGQLRTAIIEDPVRDWPVWFGGRLDAFYYARTYGMIVPHVSTYFDNVDILQAVRDGAIAVTSRADEDAALLPDHVIASFEGSPLPITPDTLDTLFGTLPPDVFGTIIEQHDKIVERVEVAFEDLVKKAKDLGGVVSERTRETLGAAAAAIKATVGHLVSVTKETVGAGVRNLKRNGGEVSERLKFHYVWRETEQRRYMISSLGYSEDQADIIYQLAIEGGLRDGYLTEFQEIHSRIVKDDVIDPGRGRFPSGSEMKMAIVKALPLAMKAFFLAHGLTEKGRPMDGSLDGASFPYERGEYDDEESDENSDLALRGDCDERTENGGETDSSLSTLRLQNGEGDSGCGGGEATLATALTTRMTSVLRTRKTRRVSLIRQSSRS